MFLSVLSLVPFALSGAYVFQCEPGNDPTVCSLWNLEYNEFRPHIPLPVVNISSTAKKVRFISERYYYNRKSSIAVYDDVLHSTVLHNPTSVQLGNNHVSKLTIPVDLLVGEFWNNMISTVVTNASKTYQLTYLDVSHNMFNEVDSLAVLLKLRTLNLEGNRITELKANLFAGMEQLSRLYLSDNAIVKIDFRMFPKVLNSLWLLRNDLADIDVANVSLPALTELDVESNRLTTIDLSALFKAFPALSCVPIGYNRFSMDEARRIVTELKRRNVTYYLGVQRHGHECDSDEFEIEQVCFPDTLFSRSIFNAFLLLLLAAVVLALYVASVRWIWFQMRY